MKMLIDIASYCQLLQMILLSGISNVTHNIVIDVTALIVIAILLAVGIILLFCCDHAFVEFTVGTTCTLTS